MQFQQQKWTCGVASVSNALKQFGITVSERKIIPVAGAISPSNCTHCRKIKRLFSKRQCTSVSIWKCRCDECSAICREYSKDCVIGTPHKGVLKAVRYFGYDHGISASEYESDSKSHAWQWLRGSLIHGRVVILCVYSWGHYVLAFASAGNRVSIFDPFPSRRNLKENGVHTLLKNDLMQMWWNGSDWVDGEKRLYAISVGR